MTERLVSIGDCLVAFVRQPNGLWQRDFAGAEMNFLIGCSRLGLKTGLITSLSADLFGNEIRQLLVREKVDITQVAKTAALTGLIFRELKEGKSAILGYYRQGTAGSCLQPDQLDETYLADSSHFHFTGIFPALSEENCATLAAGLKLARKHNLSISFDANIRWQLFTTKAKARRLLLPYIADCELFLSGKEEAEFLLETRNQEILFNRLKELGVKHMVLKMGAEGSVGFSDDEMLFQPASQVMPLDPTGAGDAFNAGYIYAHLQGWNLRKKLAFAAFLGGKVAASSSDNQSLPYLADALKEWKS